MRRLLRFISTLVARAMAALRRPRPHVGTVSMTEETFRAQAEDKVSQLFFGRKSLLVLANGAGQEQLARAYEPRPASGPFQPDELPFEDPRDPLTLTISSLCHWLEPPLYSDLVSLGRFPEVRVDLVPGLGNAGYKEVATTSVKVIDNHRWLVSSRDSSTEIGFEPHAEDVVPLMESCGFTLAAARRLTYDIAVHRALQNQFLVVPGHCGVWERRRFRWLVDLGVGTVSAAFGLTGAKARMYTSVPVPVRPGVTSSVNVGMWRDQTAIRQAWALQQALGGALRPNGPADERAVTDRLLGIRDLLVDALVARDAIYRLTRVDATQVPSASKGRRPQPGVRGNDLHELLRYHALAILNQAFAISDNLAQVVVGRCSVTAKGADRIGFALNPQSCVASRQASLDPHRSRSGPVRPSSTASCARLCETALGHPGYPKSLRLLRRKPPQQRRDARSRSLPSSPASPSVS